MDPAVRALGWCCREPSSLCSAERYRRLKAALTLPLKASRAGGSSVLRIRVLSPFVTPSSPGDELLQLFPDFGSDAVHELLAPLTEHHGDRARNESGLPGSSDRTGSRHPRALPAPGLEDRGPERRRGGQPGIPGPRGVGAPARNVDDQSQRCSCDVADRCCDTLASALVRGRFAANWRSRNPAAHGCLTNSAYVIKPIAAHKVGTRFPPRQSTPPPAPRHPPARIPPPRPGASPE